MCWSAVAEEMLMQELIRETSNLVTRLPGLEQQLPTWARLLHKPIFARKNTLPTKPRLLDNALERFVLVWRDLIPEKHR